MNEYLYALITNLVSLGTFPKVMRGGIDMSWHCILDAIDYREGFPPEWAGAKLGDDQLMLLENLRHLYELTKK